MCSHLFLCYNLFHILSIECYDYCTVLRLDYLQITKDFGISKPPPQYKTIWFSNCINGAHNLVKLNSTAMCLSRHNVQLVQINKTHCKSNHELKFPLSPLYCDNTNVTSG